MISGIKQKVQPSPSPGAGENMSNPRSFGNRGKPAQVNVTASLLAKIGVGVASVSIGVMKACGLYLVLTVSPDELDPESLGLRAVSSLLNA
jgi:hypothetical protein